MKIKRFLENQARDVFWCENNADHPTCPKCGSRMDFHGGDLPLGEGYWDCTGCNFIFTEDDLGQFDVSEYKYRG